MRDSSLCNRGDIFLEVLEKVLETEKGHHNLARIFGGAWSRVHTKCHP